MHTSNVEFLRQIQHKTVWFIFTTHYYLSQTKQKKQLWPDPVYMPHHKWYELDNNDKKVMDQPFHNLMGRQQL